MIIQLTEQQKKKYAEFHKQWIKSDFHIRGCMLESLAQDLDFHGHTEQGREYVSMVLRNIASMMK